MVLQRAVSLELLILFTFQKVNGNYINCFPIGSVQ